MVFEPAILKCSLGLKLEIIIHKFNMEEISYTETKIYQNKY
jgi:hypothetical protein